MGRGGGLGRGQIGENRPEQPQHLIAVPCPSVLTPPARPHPIRVPTHTAVFNFPPVSPDLFYWVIAGIALVRSPAQGLLSNATDPNGDAVSIASYSPPANGVLKLNLNTCAFNFTPAAGYVGTVDFTFNLQDAGAQQLLATTVTLDIRERRARGGMAAAATYALRSILSPAATACRRAKAVVRCRRSFARAQTPCPLCPGIPLKFRTWPRARFQDVPTYPSHTPPNDGTLAPPGTSCPSAMFQDSTSCTPCSANCSACTAAAVCTTCISPAVLRGGSSCGKHLPVKAAAILFVSFDVIRTYSVLVPNYCGERRQPNDVYFF